MSDIDQKDWGFDDDSTAPAVSSYNPNLLPPSDPRVAYDPMGGLKGGHACANCQWFNAGSNSCNVVYGDIVPTGLSKLWLAQPEPYDPNKPLQVEVVNKEAGKPATVKIGGKDLSIKSLQDFIYRTIKEIVNGAPPEDKSESGFKVLPDHRWVAYYTNAYEDYEKEIFPRAAHDAYVERVDAGRVPMPELWYWHMPVRHGVAEWVGRVDNVMMAVGKFDDTPEGKAFEEFYTKEGNKQRLSHGFFYPSSMKIDGVYHVYDTFEITTLPKGKEANPFTSFERIKEMPVTEEKKNSLVSILGPQLAQKYLGDAELRSKAIEDMGVKFKEVDAPLAAMDADARLAIKEIAMAAQADAVGLKALGDKLDTILTTLKEVKDGEKARNERVDQIETAVRTAFQLQPSPRQSASTVIPANNPLLQEMKEKQLVGEKATSVFDLFLGGKEAKAE